MVSTDGGAEPVWSPSGDEFFYRKGNELMVVAVETQPAFDSAAPRTLFVGESPESREIYRSYDVFPDGRFLVRHAAPGTSIDRVRLVLNWHHELDELVPANSDN